jgi:hypothetical protein
MIVERDVGVVVRDGVRLSVDVYRPPGRGRYPAILEHIPYRKDDLRVLEDRSQNGFLVDAGFACVRLDVRGTGSSGGIAEDEAPPPGWRMGTSSLDGGPSPGTAGSLPRSPRRASHPAGRPAATRAGRPPVYATDDRYTDDMHLPACTHASLPAHPTDDA